MVFAALEHQALKIAADADENFKAEVPKDANFRIKSMEVILARGTARVQTITATSENIDLSAWKSRIQTRRPYYCRY